MDIDNLLTKFTNLKVVVIGDVMVDSYWWGNVERISPEAPVPVVSINKKEIRPGGAANVAVNIQALGAQPFLFAVIGNDKSADDFLQVLKENQLPQQGILKSNLRKTTVKTRVIGNKHQLLRVDEEEANELSETDNAQFINHVSNFIETEKPSVIIFEDYDKGLLNKKNISEIISCAKKNNIPVAVDPKKKNFFNYRNVDLFKPNLKELREGLKVDLDEINKASLRALAEKFAQQQNISSVMITLSDKGIFYSNHSSSEIIPAHFRSISDVSGAGDTVISIAGLCLAAALPLNETAWLANLAGGMVCEKVGVVPIEKNQLAQEVKRLKH